MTNEDIDNVNLIMHDWIDAEEKTPEDMEIVIACGYRQEGEGVKVFPCEFMREKNFTYWLMLDKVNLTYYDDRAYKVIFWMPLPEPIIKEKVWNQKFFKDKEEQRKYYSGFA